MAGHDTNMRKSIGIFILGCVAFSYPILSIFNLKILVFGIPMLYVYIFTVWMGLIFLIFLRERTRG